MLNEFTFMVVAYNHEEYIEEHLDSIVSIIRTYGKNVSCDLVICDDASHDNTIKVINKWILSNRENFREIYFSMHKTNQGLVRNLIDGIKIIKTKEFKFLAGDDKYALSDLFGVYDYLDGKIGISNVIPFGEYTKKQYTLAMNNFNMCRCLKNAKRIGDVLNIKNIFLAPGVFIPGDLIKCEEFYNFMSEFNYIEDYPMWQYLINIKKNGIKVLETKYVFYRYGNGVSTNNKSKNNRYISERDRIYKRFNTRMYILPKVINPYAYYYFLLNTYCKIYSKYKFANQ